MTETFLAGAAQVAPARAVPDRHGLLVRGELEEVAGQSPAAAAVAQRVRRFHRPAIQFRYSYHRRLLPFG